MTDQELIQHLQHLQSLVNSQEMLISQLQQSLRHRQTYDYQYCPYPYYPYPFYYQGNWQGYQYQGTYSLITQINQQNQNQQSGNK